MKKLLLTTLIVESSLMMILAGCSSNSEQTSSIETTELELVTESKTESKTENETELVKEETTETITKPTVIEYTEDEYKSLCIEKYYDDFFKSTPIVGEYVKIHVLTSQKYRYSSGDMQGILTEDITKKYNLALNSLGCCVLHEETKDDAVPSYFGKQIYIMFVKDAELNLDSFKTGQHVIVYGKIIKNDNGTFVLPKYIEEE